MAFATHRNTKNDMTFEQADRQQYKSHQQQVKFFKNAYFLLMERGENDAAHYMDMIADWIEDEKKPLDPENVPRILGL